MSPLSPTLQQQQMQTTDLEVMVTMADVVEEAVEEDAVEEVVVAEDVVDTVKSRYQFSDFWFQIYLKRV